MAIARELRPATELARINGVRFPNESTEYRQARDALLAEEIELRRHETFLGHGIDHRVTV